MVDRGLLVQLLLLFALMIVVAAIITGVASVSSRSSIVNWKKEMLIRNVIRIVLGRAFEQSVICKRAMCGREQGRDGVSVG